MLMTDKQREMVAKIVAGRPDVVFTLGRKGNKVTMNGKGQLPWPEITVGAQGGVTIWVRSYDESKKTAFEGALEADQLLAGQNARDAKKNALGTETGHPEIGRNLISRKYSFSAENYERSRKEYAEQYQTLDDYLYRLCQELPTHSSRLSVNAKVYIISRTFMTQIERMVPSKGTQASSISQVIELFFKRSHELDALFIRLAGISDPPSTSNLADILEVHGAITGMLLEITGKSAKGKAKSPRSFVAKYMHFHNPLIPPYDDYAATVLQSITQPIGSIPISIPITADADYATYVRGLFSLYRFVAAQGLPVTVRSLDYYLLWEHYQHSVSREAETPLKGKSRG